MRYAITWIVLAAGIAIGIGSVNWSFLNRIADRGVRSGANVIGFFPKTHNSLRYEYNVAGRSFQGQSQPSTPNPPAVQLAIGSAVVIYYDPEKPEDSVLGDPKPILLNETISILLAATIVPTFLVVVWAGRTSRKKAIQALLWTGVGIVAAAASLLGIWLRINRPSSRPVTTQFITVDKEVKVQVVDWGGSGRALVFIPGLGLTARATFDEFAPKFTRDFHVYGITRRGIGSSSRPTSGYSADRLGDDVLAVLDALKLERVVLVGHSAGGSELSSVATRHPERVAGLIYLEAGYAYAYYCPESPPPPPIDQKWPAPIKAILEGYQHYTDIRAPTLAIYAIPNDLSWRFKNDPIGLAKAEAEEVARNLPQMKAFEKGVPSARVVNIPRANHWVFHSNEAEVLREMNEFLRKLPQQTVALKKPPS